MKADVLVVGGGIAGASTAFWLAQRRRVLLVEREAGFGYHSTGRSAAEWAPVHFQGVLRALVEFGRRFFDAPPTGFASAPLLDPRGALEFAAPDGMAHAPLPGREEIGIDRALDLVPFLRREALGRCYYDPGNCEIDVHALHTGFLRGVSAAGSTTLRDVEFHGAERRGDRWHARIGEQDCDAALIVDAAGAWTDVVAARAGVAPLGVEPRRRTALTFDPGFDPRRLPVVDEIGTGFYFKPAGAALMVCAGDATPSPPCDAQPEEFDIATAVDRFEQCTTLSIGRLASRWAGLRTFLPDQQPIAGFATDAPDFFFVAGQGGAGIMLSPGLGAVAAALALREPLPAHATELGVSVAALSPARLSPPPAERR